MNGPFRSTPGDIARLIALVTAEGCGHLAPLLRHVQHGAMNLIVPCRATIMPPLHRMGRKGKPLAVMLPDDDYAPAGPATWACAAKVRSWAAFAIVHGTGAQPWHYAMAADLAMLHGRLLLVETTSDAAHEWAGFLRERADLRFVGLLPTVGTHPVLQPVGTVH